MRMLFKSKTGKRSCLVISLVFAVCALGSEFVSKDYFSRSAQSVAQETSLHEKMSEAEQLQAKAERDKSMSKGSVFCGLGMGFAALSFIFWIVSGYWFRNRWSYAPVVLLAFYILFLFMMV